MYLLHLGFAFIFIGVALLALLLLGFIFFMVYKKKTKPSSSTPDSMVCMSNSMYQPHLNGNFKV